MNRNILSERLQQDISNLAGDPNRNAEYHIPSVPPSILQPQSTEHPYASSVSETWPDTDYPTMFYS